MLQPPTDDGLERALCCTAKAWERAMREQLRDEAINYRQYQVLCHLANVGTLTHGELAERMNITASSLVVIIDHLEKQQLVARRDSAHDRRSKQIIALPQAREVWLRVSALAAEIDRQATANLSSEQIEQLQHALSTVQASLGMPQLNLTKVAT